MAQIETKSYVSKWHGLNRAEHTKKWHKFDRNHWHSFTEMGGTIRTGISSNCDFTIVRPSAFINGPSTRDFKVGFDAQTRNLSLKISKADVAYFMVDQLSSEKFIKKTISISN